MEKVRRQEREDRRKEKRTESAGSKQQVEDKDEYRRWQACNKRQETRN